MLMNDVTCIVSVISSNETLEEPAGFHLNLEYLIGRLITNTYCFYDHAILFR